jgi:hypothetical protein
MPRKRMPENKGLPLRWRLVHGAYYYQVPKEMRPLWNGKYLFRLGKTLPEAYREWADRLVTTDKAKTISQLLDRYAMEVVPTKAMKTQRSNGQYITRLRAVFGAVALKEIKPQHHCCPKHWTKRPNNGLI